MELVTATRKYKPGNIIYCEPSFAQVVPKDHKNEVCEWCGAMFSPCYLKACKACLFVKYCGKDCQRRDWSTHKAECKNLKNLPRDSSTDFVRLIGKIILKLKGQDWKTVKREVFGNVYTFDDMKYREYGWPENGKRIFYVKQIRETTRLCIGDENLPSFEDFRKILGKVELHAVLSHTVAFYIGICAFDEQCIPNACLANSERRIKIWACKNISKGVDKISLSTRTILLTRNKILDDLQQCVRCKCADCSLPYGDSVLTKVIDTAKAFQVVSDTERFLKAAASFPSLILHPERIDGLLERQRGILGDTNYLRLRVLALKYKVDPRPLAIKDTLLELERCMSSIFGEYYFEMLPIYENLIKISALLGDIAAAGYYTTKMVRIGAE